MNKFYYTMEILKVDPENLRESKTAIQKAAQIVKQGGVVVIPTDTTYVFTCDVSNEFAVKQIFKIKKRPLTKPIPIFVSDVSMAKKLAYINAKIEKALNLIWPGSVTAVLERKKILPEIVYGNKNTVGLRLPDYKLVHFLQDLVLKPLSGTSANISDMPVAYKIQDVLEQFKNQTFKPDLILDAGELKNIQPSTVIDFIGPKPKILRIGPVSKKELLEILSV